MLLCLLRGYKGIDTDAARVAKALKKARTIMMDYVMSPCVFHERIYFKVHILGRARKYTKRHKYTNFFLIRM